MKNLLMLLPIVFLLFLSSCLLDKGTTDIDFGGRLDPKGALESGMTNAQVSSVSVVGDQLVINGSSLQGIETVKITDNGSFTKTFSIDSKSSSQIIANGIDAVSIMVGQVFDLVIGNAYGQAVFPVTFTLQNDAVTSSKILDGEVMTADIANGAVTPAKLSTAGASAGSVLQFDGSNWNLINLNGLTYQGTWNANTNTPSFGAANCDSHNPGDYYAVSVSGSTSVDGESSWAAGDWIICSNGLWDKVINTTNITSVFGRTGAVTATLSDMTDVDSSLTSVDGQLLIFRAANSRYETANFIDFDWTTGNVTFSNNLTITGTGLTVAGTAVCLADGTNCTYPTPTSVVNSSSSAVVNASSGLDAVELQVGGVTGAQLNAGGTFVVNNFQVSGGTPGAGKVLMSDVSGNGTWQDVAISNVTNLQTTLDAKVAKADVPACTDATKQLVWDGSTWACLTFTDTNTNAGTICVAGEYLDGDGTCKSVAAGGADNSQAVNVQLTADNDSNASGEIQFLTGASQKMVIDNTGNVGVGVLAPSAKLEVAGQVKITGGTPGAGKILTSDAVGLASWQAPPSNTLIVDADNNTKIQVEESADDNIIRFDTAGAERARIDALGNIIFGASTVTPLAGTLVTVGGTMKVSPGSDVCIDGGACLSTVDTNTTYTGGDGLTLTGTDFAVNVDGSTLETNLDTLRVKDLGITDAKISAVGVQKVTSSAGNYLTYAPNGVSCALDQVLKLDLSGTWICANDIDTTDNLGSHVATQNLDLANFKLVGNGGSTGVEIDASGNVGVGAAVPGAKLEVAGQVKITGGIPGSGKILTSDATGLASWQAPSSNALIVDADNNTKIQVEESADENIIRFDTAGVERARIDALGNIIFGATTVTPLAGTLVTVGGSMKVSSGSDICIDGGACLSTVDTNTTYTGGDGLTLVGADFAVNVDSSTLETNLDTLRVKDAGITDAKIVGVGVQKVTSSVGNYLTYAPNGTACTLNQVLKLNASGQWICANDVDTTYTGGDGLSLTGADFSVNVDSSTLETNLDTLRVKDAGITDAKIVGVGVQKVASSAGNYLTYSPSGIACTLNQVLKLDASGQWICANDTDTTDNLGSHLATQNLDLANFKLVGNGGTNGVEIDALGNVGIGTASPATTLDINGTMKLAKNSSAPYACDASKDGALALTSRYTTCVCNGASWVLTSDGGSPCAWVTTNIALSGPSRRWSDGTYAVSCNKYKNPPGGFVYSGSTGDGLYAIDPDGPGGFVAFDVYCDMTTDGGGWTIVYAATGADGEQAMVSDTEITGADPMSFLHYNMNRTKKMNISAVSTTSLIKRNAGTWIKWNAAMFDVNLNTPSSHVHNAVTVTASNGTTSSGYAGYSNYNNAGGGDYGVTNSANFDHHSGTYYHLNTGCSNHFFYHYSNGVGDSDAGYDVNISLGDWAATIACDSPEGGLLVFFAAMR